MIQAREIVFGYKPNHRIIDKISFDVDNGQCVAILGNNGAGKSTMLKCLNRILSPREGVVVVDDLRINDMGLNEVAKQMAFVAQQNDDHRITVFDAVMLGRLPFVKWGWGKADEAIVAEVLRQLNLEDFAVRYLDELSGGERQKVMIARAMAQQPRVLLLDEPTSSLDMRNQMEVLNLVKKVCRERNIAVIIVIHDLNMALRCCDRFLLLKNGKTYAYGGSEVVTPQVIEAVYGMKVEIIEHRHLKLVVPE